MLIVQGFLWLRSCEKVDKICSLYYEYLSVYCAIKNLSLYGAFKNLSLYCVFKILVYKVHLKILLYIKFLKTYDIV